MSQITRVVHGTFLSVPFRSHSNLCLSHPMGFPLHYYNINMEYNSIKIGGGARALVRQPKTAVFLRKSLNPSGRQGVKFMKVQV